MKTPRELLLEKHRAVEPKLEAIRESVLANAPPSAANRARPMFPVRAALRCWEELVVPCRRIWAGLAVMWAVIFVFKFAAADTPSASAKRSEPVNAQVIMALREQKQLLQQLMETAAPAPEAVPNRATPRGERRETIMIG
jgi:hypothetical protein